MATIAQPFLFSWHQIDAESDLSRLKLVLHVIPDDEFARALEQRRGNGRNDYPIRPTWNALLAGVVFQHPSAASLLRELRRNGELRDLCGFDPFAGASAVPTEDAFGRFLATVIECREELLKTMDRLVEMLAELLPDLGESQAIDSKAIRSFGKPVRDEEKAADADGRRDRDADWGRKEYKGKRKDGTTWKKVVRWFGFKLHLIVDAKHELPLAYILTKASAADTTHMKPLVRQLNERQPTVSGRSKTMAADKGYDSRENNRFLLDDHQTKPVIAKREGLWKDGEQTRPIDPSKADSFVYDEAGNVFCVCPETGCQRTMSFMGYESDRTALKYRCPATAKGFECPGRELCESMANVGDFGRTIRIHLDTDRRIFTPIARHSHQWQRTYDGRTSVERVNSRIDLLLGFEKHHIRGIAKMEMRMSLALAVMLAMALGRIRLNQRDQMRSFLAPVRMAA